MRLGWTVPSGVAVPSRSRTVLVGAQHPAEVMTHTTSHSQKRPGVGDKIHGPLILCHTALRPKQTHSTMK